MAIFILMLKGLRSTRFDGTGFCKFSIVNQTYFRADCSSKNITNISKLWFNDSVIDINLNKNNLQIISARNPFPRYLRKLDISSCQLFSIELGALEKMKNLTHLDVSHNMGLTLHVLPNITNDLIGSNIKSLKLNAIQCPIGPGVTLRYEHLCRLQNTSLSELELSHNRIDMVEQFTILSLPKTLIRVSAGQNRLRFGWYFLEVGSHKYLRFLNFSGMYATENPFKFHLTCIDGGDLKQQKSPKLQSCQKFDSSVKRSFMNGTITKYHIPYIETLVISNCVIRETEKSAHLKLVYHSLKRLYANDNFLPKFQYIDYSQRLEEAYLYNCYMRDIDDSLFLTTNLSRLDLSHNYLNSYFSKEKVVRLFQRQVHLTFLNLAHNGLRNIPENLFQNLSRLKVLNLSKNELTEINFKMNGLKQLTTMDISYNKLPTLSESNLRDIDVLSQDSPRSLTLNLMGNTFQCTCDTLFFIRWIKSKQNSVHNILLTSLQNDTCSFTNLKKKKLSEISAIILELEKICFSKSILIVTSVLFLIIFFGFISFGIFHRYRWKLRYFYHLTRRSLRGYFLLQKDNIERRKYFQFDAFISYAEEDGEFAYENLRSEILKQEPSIKLCFHQEQFLPGSSIAENIVNAVHNSRKTICVVSKHFLVSEWCLYEFNMANIEKIYNRGDENSLIILLLGNVSPDSIPVTMMSYLKSTSYMEVPKNIDADVFWNHLCDVMYND